MSQLCATDVWLCVAHLTSRRTSAAQKKCEAAKHKHLQNQLNKPGGDAADVAAAGQGQHEGKNVAFRVHSVFMCAACSQKTVS